MSRESDGCAGRICARLEDSNISVNLLLVRSHPAKKSLLLMLSASANASATVVFALYRIKKRVLYASTMPHCMVKLLRLWRMRSYRSFLQLRINRVCIVQAGSWAKKVFG